MIRGKGNKFLSSSELPDSGAYLVPGVLYSGIMRPEHEADLSPPSMAKLKMHAARHPLVHDVFLT